MTTTAGNGLRPGRSRPGRPDLGWTELVATTVLLGLFLAGTGIGWVVLAATVGAAESLIAWLLVAAVGAAPVVAWSIRVRDLGAIGLRAATSRLIGLGLGAGALLGVLAATAETAAAAATGVAAWAYAPEQLGIAAVLPLAMVAPFAFELLFRGMCFGAVRRYGVVPALTVSTVACAGMSVAGVAGGPGVTVVLTGLVAVALGVLTGLLYERSASLWPSVAASFAFGVVELLRGLLW